MTRAGQIKVATLVAAAESLIRIGDRIVCLTGIDGSGTIDTIIVLDLGTEIEMFADTAADPLPADVTPAVFERLLTLASELGLEGREGRPVGTLFVVGDSDRVLAQSHQLVINPFHGYPEAERNVLDPRLEETIKEFSAIDGAFIIRGDGVILERRPLPRPRRASSTSRCRRASAPATRPPPAITVTTDAIALCVSQSTGTVSIFRRGRLVTDIQKPRGPAHSRRAADAAPAGVRLYLPLVDLVEVAADVLLDVLGDLLVGEGVGGVPASVVDLALDVDDALALDGRVRRGRPSTTALPLPNCCLTLVL